MTDRNRREDLLKVADLFYAYLHRHDDGSIGIDGYRPFGFSTGGGIYEILIDALHITPMGEEFSEEQLDYARALFAELPAFLKAEWETHRETQSMFEAFQLGKEVSDYLTENFNPVIQK